jgi:Glycosyltransferase family 87
LTSSARGKTWALCAWLLAALVVCVGGLSHDEQKAVDAAITEGRYAWTPASLLAAVRATLTNDGDLRRYYSYANAALGRPYQAQFVKPLGKWKSEFEENAARSIDPDSRPWITPGRAQLPYRDYLVEYPPGFFLFALPPALPPLGPHGYGRLFALWMAALLSLSLWLSLRCAPALGAAVSVERLFGWGALCMVGLGVVCTHRYDAAAAVLITAAAWGVLRERPLLGGIAAGLAIGTKLTPALAAGALGVFLLARGRWKDLLRYCLGGALALAALLVPSFLLAG